MDYGSSKSRGFGFVNFKDPEVAKTVLSQVHRIQGRLCEVRLPRCKVSKLTNFCILLTLSLKFRKKAMRIKELIMNSVTLHLLGNVYCQWIFRISKGNGNFFEKSGSLRNQM